MMEFTKENKDCERYETIVMFVNFTSYQERVACGEVGTLYTQRTFHFNGLDHLLLMMEDMMDYIRASSPAITFPQASCAYRSIRKGKSDTAFQDMDGTQIMNQPESSSQQTKMSSSFAMITVYYRQNASM